MKLVRESTNGETEWKVRNTTHGSCANSLACFPISPPLPGHTAEPLIVSRQYARS